MADSRKNFVHREDSFSLGTTNVSEGNLHHDEHVSRGREKFTPSPVTHESQTSAPQYQYDGLSFGEVDDNLHDSSNATSKGYQSVATSTFAVNQHEAPRIAPTRGLVSRVFLGWWKEIIWSLISIACLPAMTGMLSRFENRPLPDWPHGITLNTAVAFIATLCRTAFLYPVVQALSQLKWNWYRKPRPLQDFRVFDEASRGPWGSLKLLFTTRGRGMGVLAALILVSSIATSTLTQSVVTYPTHMIPILENGTATSIRAQEFYWVTANMNAQRDVMIPFTLAIPQSIYTRPETPITYTSPTCRTSECTWELFSSLAVCIEMRNVTDQLSIEESEDGVQGPKMTLPNGAMLQYSYGYSNMNISTGTSLSFNNTEMMKVPIIDYTVIFDPPARAYEVLLHFCVNTYNASVTGNIPTVMRTASYTNAVDGEVFVKHYNSTLNATTLTTPDDPDTNYVVGGLGPSQLEDNLASSITGDYRYLLSYNMSGGVAVFGTSIERAKTGININDTQAIDDAQAAAVYNLSSNLAMGLTNALSEWNTGTEAPVNGTAWTQQTYVRIRWEWVTLLVIQVFLSLVVLIIAIAHTEMIGIPIIKGNPLPGLFAIGAQERFNIEQEQLKLEGSGEEPSKAEHVLDGDLQRQGSQWVLGNVSRQRRATGRAETIYVGEHGNWPS